MDNENHKNTWNNFTKFVLWGTVAIIGVLVLMAIFLIQSSLMRIASILEVAKLFGSKIKLVPARAGERYASALTNMNLSNKVHKIFGKINLKDYVENIVKNS